MTITAELKFTVTKVRDFAKSFLNQYFFIFVF